MKTETTRKTKPLLDILLIIDVPSQIICSCIHGRFNLIVTSRRESEGSKHNVNKTFGCYHFCLSFRWTFICDFVSGWLTMKTRTSLQSILCLNWETELLKNWSKWRWAESGKGRKYRSKAGRGLEQTTEERQEQKSDRGRDNQVLKQRSPLSVSVSLFMPPSCLLHLAHSCLLSSRLHIHLSLPS